MFWSFISEAGVCKVSFIFLFGYVLLLLLLFCFLTLTIETNEQNNTYNWSFKHSTILTKFILVCLFLAFAGIPPFYFFFCKLAVLCLLLLSANWATASAAILLIIVAWYSYFNAISSLLGATATNVKSKQPTSVFGVVNLTCFSLLLLGWFFFDDLIVCCYWLSI